MKLPQTVTGCFGLSYAPNLSVFDLHGKNVLIKHKLLNTKATLPAEFP